MADGAGRARRVRGPRGAPTLANLVQASQGTYLQTFVTSTVLSAVTAVLGAVFGGLLAWAISVGRRDGLLRRLVLAGQAPLLSSAA